MCFIIMTIISVSFERVLVISKILIRSYTKHCLYMLMVSMVNLLSELLIDLIYHCTWLKLSWIYCLCFHYFILNYSR